MQQNSADQFNGEIQFLKSILVDTINLDLRIIKMISGMSRFGIVLITIFGLPFLCHSSSDDGNSLDSKDYASVASSLVKDDLDYKNEPSIGHLLQTFMETEGGKHLGELVLQQAIKNPDLMSNLGKIVSNVGDSLTQKRPLGSVDRSSGVGSQSHPAFSRGNEIEPNNSNGGGMGGEEYWASMVAGAVTNYLSGPQNGGLNGESGGSILDGIMSYLPVLANSLTGGHIHYEDKELEDKEEHSEYEHSGHFLPPYLNFLKDYWEHFKKSELGETLWNSSHLGSLFQMFVDKDGYFQIDRIFDSMENHSLRRRWITSLTSFSAQWIKHIAQPTTLKRYMNTAQFIGNSFLQSQGYSKAALFDPNRPAASLSILMNAVFKRHFGLHVNSAKYIRPAVTYIEDLMHIGHSKGLTITNLSDKDIERKLAETLNEEVIEPVLRVWRAYRYSIKHPQCDRYLICTVSTLTPGDERLTGLKPGIKKLSSLISSWFLSRRTGTPFWKFYYAATENYICEKKFPVDCKGFHEEEEASREYRHNEL